MRTSSEKAESILREDNTLDLEWLTLVLSWMCPEHFVLFLVSSKG